VLGFALAKMRTCMAVAVGWLGGGGKGGGAGKNAAGAFGACSHVIQRKHYSSGALGPSQHSGREAEPARYGTSVQPCAPGKHSLALYSVPLGALVALLGAIRAGEGPPFQEGGLQPGR